MWDLLPESTQRYARETFGFDGMYIRDDVVNLILGFRKMSVSNIGSKGGTQASMWGKNAPIVRTADKVWKEVITLQRIKIAVLTPAVVVGNIASNTAMLLFQGIKPNYIRKMGSEAISAMRQYQKDLLTHGELERKIGAWKAAGRDTTQAEIKLGQLEADINMNPVTPLIDEGLFTSITSDLGVNDDTIRGTLINKAIDKSQGIVPRAVVKGVQEAYMLPGSMGYKAGVAATQYGDFVARYIKYHWDTQVKGVEHVPAIRDALAQFIYYDIPQSQYLQAMNDYGGIMFTKFFLRIQPIVAKMFSQNPVGAVTVVMMQSHMLPKPFDENIFHYGLGSGVTSKPTMPWNIPGRAFDTLNPAKPAALDWLLNPFGL
jgi:hypothetical protein